MQIVEEVEGRRYIVVLGFHQMESSLGIAGCESRVVRPLAWRRCDASCEYCIPYVYQHSLPHVDPKYVPTGTDRAFAEPGS